MISMIMNVIATRISNLRVSHGESQQALADSLGVKRETVKFWESASRQIKGDDIAKIARHYNVSSDYIMGLTEVMTPDKNEKALYDMTGLSEKAVHSLLLWCSDSSVCRVLNAILSDEDWKDCAFALGELMSNVDLLEEAMPEVGSLPMYSAKYMSDANDRVRVSRFEAIDRITRFVDKLTNYWDMEKRFEESWSDVRAYEYRQKTASGSTKAEGGYRNSGYEGEG